CKKHGWPFPHLRPHCPSDSKSTGNGRLYRERIDRWILYSRLARAVGIAFISKSKDERVSAVAELRRFLAQVQGTPGLPPAWEPYRVILHWLASGELRLWFGNQPARLLLYGVPPLWKALGMEMAMLAVGAKGLVLCSACGKLDTVKKPGRPGNRS